MKKGKKEVEEEEEKGGGIMQGGGDPLSRIAGNTVALEYHFFNETIAGSPFP